MSGYLLKIVSKRLKKSLRKTDTISRWGGDEFTIILPKIKDSDEIMSKFDLTKTAGSDFHRHGKKSYLGKNFLK